jgi:hypothetical protein
MECARLGPWSSWLKAYYGFAADAAELAAAVADAASEAAEEASEAIGAAAGGGVSAAGAGASVLLPQALRTNAAAMALITSLVFIYRYPKF